LSEIVVKKKIAALLAHPVSVFVAWLGEKFEIRLYGVDEMPDPLKVLTPVEPWHGKATSKSLWDL